jgi:hypothetical protein
VASSEFKVGLHLPVGWSSSVFKIAAPSSNNSRAIESSSFTAREVKLEIKETEVCCGSYLAILIEAEAEGVPVILLAPNLHPVQIRHPGLGCLPL